MPSFWRAGTVAEVIPHPTRSRATAVDCRKWRPADGGAANRIAARLMEQLGEAA